MPHVNIVAMSPTPPPSNPPETPRTGRRFRGVALEDRQAERRKKLIEAGIEVFGHSGFHGATVRQVCVAAGLTERYFYESFSNREALFGAVYDHQAERLQQLILDTVARAPADLHQLVAAALRGLYEAVRNDPRLARILFMEVFTVQNAMGERMPKAMEGFTALLVGLLQRFLPPGHRPEADLTWVATGLVGASTQILTRWVLTGFRDPLDQVVGSCALLFDALIDRVTQPVAAS